MNRGRGDSLTPMGKSTAEEDLGAGVTLLERARTGDEDAFAELVEPHRSELRAYCYRMLGSVQDADDAAQNALLRAWRGLAAFEGRSSVRSWLYSIATNTALDITRHRTRRELPVGFGPASSLDAEFEPAVTDPVWLEPCPEQWLSHSAPAIGYRLAEPDARRMLPDKLAAAGIEGPDIGLLQRQGSLAARGRVVTIGEVSEPRPGQRFAFIMDTRLCDGAFELAERADMLVCESTFAATEATLAREYGHLTAGQAGRIAAESGARLLVLTHFSQRYDVPAVQRFAVEAAEQFGGEVVIAADLDRIPVPPRMQNVQPPQPGAT